MSLETALRAAGKEAGLTAVGFCSASPFPEAEADLTAAKESGRSAGLGFTFSDPATATDPRRSFPWARSIVAAARAYLPEAGNPDSVRSGTGRIARFATADHYRELSAGLERLASVLVEAGFQTEVLCDDSRFMDRVAAVRAGIAWWGKSAMVLTPGVGPWTLLGSVVTDAALIADEPMRRNCGTCEACIPACPTGAIIAPGILDSRRCLAAAAQSAGVIPRWLRAPMADRFYGCDECLIACPPGDRVRDLASAPSGRVDLEEMLALDDEELRHRFAHFFVPRNEGRYLKRNALVALGNSGEGRSVPTVLRFLQHDDVMLRLHAAWALGRLGGGEAESALRARRDCEPEEAVRSEIDHALGTLG